MQELEASQIGLGFRGGFLMTFFNERLFCFSKAEDNKVS